MLSYKNENEVSDRAVEIQFLSKSGFLLLEFLMALVLGLTFIFVALYFQSTLVSMYEQLLVHRVALNLAINAIEEGGQGHVAGLCSRLEQDANVSGRNFRISFGESPSFEGAAKNRKNGHIKVIWNSCLGKNEKLELGTS
jgi:hypothetical protein